MKINAYTIASPQSLALGSKRQVETVFGLEDARVVRGRKEAYRARSRRQQQQHLAADDGGSEPDFTLDGDGGGGGGPQASSKGRGSGPKGEASDRSREYLQQPSAHEHALPPDDLLKHIHRQTTLLYSREHSGGIGHRLLDPAHEAEYARRRRSKHHPGSEGGLSDKGSRMGSDDDGESELDSSDDGAGSDRTMGSRRSSRSGHSLRRQTSRTSVASAGQEDGVAAKKHRGRSNTRKNMYKALTGDTLIALGILMEEFIKHSVTAAGYPDITGGALDFDAASDDEHLPEMDERVVKFALPPVDDAAAPEESSDSLSSDEDEDEDEAGARSGKDAGDSDTSSGTDSSSSGLTRRRNKSQSRERKVDVEAEERRRRKRLFREEEDRYQMLEEAGVGEEGDESESDGD